MSDYLPSRDTEFHLWLENFGTEIANAATTLGLDTAEITAIQAEISAWSTAYGAHVVARDVARGRRATKDLARRTVATAVRELVRRVQVHPAITDDIRAALRVTVPSNEASSLALAVAQARPVVTVHAGHRLRHRLVFRDESSPTRTGKPEGMRGCEIWMKLGDAPAGPEGMTLIGEVTRTRHTLEFPAADGGKLAHYALRWISTRGDKGPWSLTVSATVGA